MTTAAQRLATFYQGYSEVYHGNVYDDGVVLSLAVGEDTAQKWADAFQNARKVMEHTAEFAWSKDRLGCVFILRGDTDTLAALCGAIGARLHPDWDEFATIVDNRQKDDHLIDQFVSLVARVQEQTETEEPKT